MTEMTEDEINARANEKARKRKVARDRMLATKTIEKGLLIVHTGKGKGKSTAAFGLVMRALGHGMRVGIIQFVKGKWVFTVKGGRVRCRLVAQELRYGERLDELSAGTPSLGAVRLALTHAMTKKNFKAMVMDVKRAFLYGDAKRKVYIELPHTDPRYDDSSVVGKLKKSMYGTRDAAQCFDAFAEDSMKKLGFKIGEYSPCIYYNPERAAICVRHGDDFILLAERGTQIAALSGL